MNVHDTPSREFSSDEAINAIDPRPVLASLARLTGDRSYIAQEFRQSPVPEIDAARIAAARKVLEQYFQENPNPQDLKATPENGAGVPDSELVEFLTNGAGDAYKGFISQQIAGNVSRAAHVEKKVAIIGGGLSGIAAAIRLVDSGCSVVVFERNSEIGGTWSYNDYPGCRLDTNNFTYTYSFSPSKKWSNYYSAQPEVLKYLKDVAHKHGIDGLVELGARVLECSWSETDKEWTLAVEKDGVVTHSRYDMVVSALGQFGVPQFPQIDGIEDFAGLKVHSNQWPKDLDLSGKRVGVIGTGATGFQLIPELAKVAKEVVVFQRNPPWLLPTPEYNRMLPYSASVLFDTLPGLSDWYRLWQFWISVEGRFPLTEVDPEWTEKGSVSKRNSEFREMLIRHLAGQFNDRPDLLEKVIPKYPPGAKRMLRDDGTWARTLKQPHVRLETSPIDALETTGVRLSTSEVVELDALVFASGFAASDYLPDLRVLGRDGKDIHEVWSGEARAYMGAMVPGFPNFFMVYGPNTSLVVNGSIMFMSECAVNFVANCMELLTEQGASAIEVTDDAYRRFIQEMDDGNDRRAWSVVKNYYQNQSGKVTQVWPHSLLEFWKRTRNVSREDVMLTN